MIDDKINNSLRELEQSLQNIEAARKQVERTVRSYDGLNDTTAEYVKELNAITANVQELIDNINTSYNKKIKEFEKDRDAIVKATTEGTKKLSNATDEFATSLFSIEKKLTYSLIINVVSLIAIGAISFMMIV